MSFRLKDFDVVAQPAKKAGSPPLPTAVAMTAIVAVLDATIVAGLLEGSYAMFASTAGTWLPFALMFLAIWVTGIAVLAIPSRAEPAGSPDR